jgi:hypothetical protein
MMLLPLHMTCGHGIRCKIAEMMNWNFNESMMAREYLPELQTRRLCYYW